MTCFFTTFTAFNELRVYHEEIFNEVLRASKKKLFREGNLLADDEEI